MNCKAPVVRRKIWGRRLCCYKLCPYSTSDYSNRIPAIERSEHYTTSGAMAYETVDGHNHVYMCLDDNCSFYKGTATTPIQLSLREQYITTSGTYNITEVVTSVTPCNGTRFYEP